MKLSRDREGPFSRYVNEASRIKDADVATGVPSGRGWSGWSLHG
jgi:hypothetical protein